MDVCTCNSATIKQYNDNEGKKEICSLMPVFLELISVELAYAFDKINCCKYLKRAVDCLSTIQFFLLQTYTYTHILVNSLRENLALSEKNQFEMWLAIF